VPRHVASAAVGDIDVMARRGTKGAFLSQYSLFAAAEYVFCSVVHLDQYTVPWLPSR